MLYGLRRIINSIPLISVSSALVLGIVIGTHLPKVGITIGEVEPVRTAQK